MFAYFTPIKIDILLTQIMQKVITPSLHARRVQNFFHLIDRFAKATGASVSQIVEIEKLRSLPDGSFGRGWADFLDRNNLQPLTTGTRRKQLHDGIHVLTGYGSDPIGEAEVQAFILGAKFGFLNLLIGIGVLRMIRKRLRDQTQVAKARMWEAYLRGNNSKFDPDRWKPELLWDLPLTEVRAMFSLN